MDRRTFLTGSSKILGVLTISPGLLVFNSCSNNEKTAYNGVFSTDDVRSFNELGDVIIPPTNTPGAKAAQVGEFIALIVQDCYSQEDKVKFKRNLADVNTFSRQNFSCLFLDCTEQQRIELVSKMEIDHEGYKSIKGLILSAYLSSEIAMTQLFGYYPVPGRFDGCTSDRPW